MNRISRLMANRGARKLLVPFLTVGYPDAHTSAELAEAALDSGASLLELGMPFSDPLADGPQIQLSSQIALRNKISLRDVLATVEAIRRHHETPIILMGYFNPVLTFGIDKFLKAAKSAGVDGLIIPDLPVEESQDYLATIERNELSSVFLVAPTSSRTRTRQIERNCSDFVYAVTITGVTGARQTFDRDTDRYLCRLRKELRKPFVAGFGVSSSESARRLVRYADGVVIGSKLISIVESTRRGKQAASEISTFLREIRQSLDTQ